MDTNQLLERYRLLSRDVQNGLQEAQKQIGLLPQAKHSVDIKRLTSTLAKIDDSWQDFAGWILVSTLDDLEDAKKNCAPGRLDVQSKLLRSKLRRSNDTLRNGITIDTSDTVSIVIESYIPYFEQMLDLLVGNAIKYSPRGGTVELSNERLKKSAGCKIRLSSLGPLVQKHEIASLGTKGFRSEAAKKCNLTGDGYGLFNVKRLADLLGAKVAFSPSQKPIDLGGVNYASFDVTLLIPEAPLITSKD